MPITDTTPKITELTSAGGTVVITNPTATIRNLETIGGGGTITQITTGTPGVLTITGTPIVNIDSTGLPTGLLSGDYLRWNSVASQFEVESGNVSIGGSSALSSNSVNIGFCFWHLFSFRSCMCWL